MNRRDTLRILMLGGVSHLVLTGCEAKAPTGSAAAKEGKDTSDINWGRGPNGQRIADRGDGTFLNPILSGDHPDPSIIKDGDVYYMTFSSFDAYPGLLIWKSLDLVNWSPMNAALSTYIGSVWAPDLVKHAGKYYIYIPGRTEDYKSIYVIWADSIEGPWSDPVDLKLPDHIDPGHIVGEDEKRYLFLSAGDMV